MPHRGTILCSRLGLGERSHDNLNQLMLCTTDERTKSHGNVVDVGGIAMKKDANSNGGMNKGGCPLQVQSLASFGNKMEHTAWSMKTKRSTRNEQATRTLKAVVNLMIGSETETIKMSFHSESLALCLISIASTLFLNANLIGPLSHSGHFKSTRQNFVDVHVTEPTTH